MEQTRQRYDKLPTSKIYTTWARILSDRNIFCTPRGGRTPAGSNTPGTLLVFFPRLLAEDFRFSLGQTNIRRNFRYT